MKKYQSLILITIIILISFSCTSITPRLKETIKKGYEQAYFEGQKDAINRDIRIKLSNDSIYYWIKSPWDNGDKPIFIPTYLNTK